MRCDICKLPVARMPSYSAYLLACLSFGHPLQVFFYLYLTERKRGRAARWSLLPIQDTVLYAFFDDLDNNGDKGFKNFTCINKPKHEAKETLRIQKLIQTNPHKISATPNCNTLRTLFFKILFPIETVRTN